MESSEKRRSGGPQLGAGRKPGDPAKVRRHRVAALFTDAEIAQLKALAKDRALPVGTALYELAAPALKRRVRKDAAAARSQS